MPETDSVTPWTHREGRKPSRTSRAVWAISLMIGWIAWFVLVDGYLAAHGHRDWTDVLGTTSWGGLIAAFAYWPVAMIAWRLAFPSDGTWVPWQRWNDQFESGRRP
jgi:hypothetical protein